MTTATSTTRTASSTSRIVPEWAVEALGGADATLALGRQIARRLRHELGLRGSTLADYGHALLMAEAEGRADDAKAALLDGLSREMARR